MSWIGNLKTVFGQHKRLITINYLIFLLLALPLALIINQILISTLGHSVSAERLIGDFDYTTWRDLYNHHGQAFGPLWTIIILMISLAIILAGPVCGGTYACLSSSESRLSMFWSGVKKYWWRYSCISLVSLIVLALWSILLFSWFFKDLFTFLEYWRDDRKIVWTAMLLIVIWSLGLYLLFVWTNMAKVDQLTRSKNPFQSLRQKFRAALKSCISLARGLVVIMGLGLLSTIIYLWSSSLLAPSSVFILLLLQQVISWLKVGWRLSAYEFIRVNS